MNEHLWKQQLTAYEADYGQWSAEQGALLREGRLSDLDRQNLAEEIESLVRSDRREIENRLTRLLAHLLKYRNQPEQRSNNWRATIRVQRGEIGRLVEESPSLASHPLSVLSRAYELARWEAIGETGMPEATFPESCPFTIEQILGPSYLPEPDD